MRTAIPQVRCLDRLLEDIETTNVRLAALVAGLDDARLAWRPPAVGKRQPPGWSIGQVFEHLCVAADSYLERIRPLVRDDAPRAAPDAMWQPSLLGGFLVWSLRSPRKLRAPRIYRVGPDPRPGVVDEFERRQGALAVLLRAAAPLDWFHIRTRAPISRLVRLNLGDCFAILVVHAQRHAGQVERVRMHPGFPCAETASSPHP